MALTAIEIESGIPNKCPGCDSDDYQFSVVETGPRSTKNVCSCGAVVGGQGGRTFKQMCRAYGVEWTVS